jgi:hypothetical protein
MQKARSGIMDSSKKYRAKFEFMILPDGFAREPKGPFEVEVFNGCRPESLKPYWKSRLIPTHSEFGIRGCGSSKKAMEKVEEKFRQKIQDWV